jgi:hypothetical protein
MVETKAGTGLRVDEGTEAEGEWSMVVGTRKRETYD